MAVIIRLTLIQNNKAACFNTKIHYEEIHETFDDQNSKNVVWKLLLKCQTMGTLYFQTRQKSAKMMFFKINDNFPHSVGSNLYIKCPDGSCWHGVIWKWCNIKKKFGAIGSLFIKHNSKEKSGYYVEIVIVIMCKSLLWNKKKPFIKCNFTTA